MLLKELEHFKGGRALFFLIPIALFTTGTLMFPTEVMTQISNFVTLVLAIALLFTYWESIVLFLREKRDAGVVWMNLGIFTLIVTTVVARGYSTYLHYYARAPQLPDSLFVCAIAFVYAFSFGCFFLAARSRDQVVPPHGWWALLGLVAGAAVTVVVLNHFVWPQFVW